MIDIVAPFTHFLITMPERASSNDIRRGYPSLAKILNNLYLLIKQFERQKTRNKILSVERIIIIDIPLVIHRNPVQ